jgi:hypothetical protein
MNNRSGLSIGIFTTFVSNERLDNDVQSCQSYFMKLWKLGNNKVSKVLDQKCWTKSVEPKVLDQKCWTKSVGPNVGPKVWPSWFGPANSEQFGPFLAQTAHKHRARPARVGLRARFAQAFSNQIFGQTAGPSNCRSAPNGTHRVDTGVGTSIDPTCFNPIWFDPRAGRAAPQRAALVDGVVEHERGRAPLRGI